MTSMGLVTQPSLPLHPTFSGHETFPFRYAWLKKGLDGLTNQADIFGRDDAIVTLGVGKNMVRSIRHWCLATQVMEEGALLSGRTRQLVPSALGRALFLDPGHDKYLEDPATLWLLHWHLATNARRATTWYWAFNLLREPEFTRQSLIDGLNRLGEERTWGNVSESTLKSDVHCFLRTYAPGRRGPASTNEESLDCPLTGLGLLLNVGDRYRFNTEPKDGLPAEIFVYALLHCWEERHRHQETLSLREIVYGEGSPGRIFRLDDDTVLSYLDQLADTTQGRLTFSDTVMIRQVARHGEIRKEEILKAYYAD